MKCGATFSPDRVYRYRLWRDFGKGPIITFCMLNPSTADESKNDPTIERCQRRAIEWGFGRLEVVNLFALRSTDPAELYTHRAPIGPMCDEDIATVYRLSDMFVCAWGKHGALYNRGQRVMAMLASPKLHVLKWNRDGTPAHPLYLPYSLKPTRVK
jgi:hypothetical protein